jgi:hypothetical protein
MITFFYIERWLAKHFRTLWESRSPCHRLANSGSGSRNRFYLGPEPWLPTRKWNAFRWSHLDLVVITGYLVSRIVGREIVPRSNINYGILVRPALSTFLHTVGTNKTVSCCQLYWNISPYIPTYVHRLLWSYRYMYMLVYSTNYSVQVVICNH